MIDVKTITKGVAEAVPAAKAGHARIRANDRTIARARSRKSWILLDFKASDAEKAPKRLLTGVRESSDGKKRLLTVNEKNAKRAHDLLGWLAQNSEKAHA